MQRYFILSGGVFYFEPPCMSWLGFSLSVPFCRFLYLFAFICSCVSMCVLMYKFNNNNDDHVFNVILHLSVITCMSLFPYHS